MHKAWCLDWCSKSTSLQLQCSRRVQNKKGVFFYDKRLWPHPHCVLLWIGNCYLETGTCSVDIWPYETNLSLLWESHSHGDNRQNNGLLFSGLSCFTPRLICTTLGSARLWITWHFACPFKLPVYHNASVFSVRFGLLASRGLFRNRCYVSVWD